MNLGDLIIRIIVNGDNARAEIEKFVSATQKSVPPIEESNRRTGLSFSKIGEFAQKAFFTIQTAKIFLQPLGDMVRESAAAELAMKKVEQAVSSTGQTAGFTAPQLAEFAKELQGITTFGDDQILNEVTAQILTFTNITGEQFKRTQQAALDVATVLDGDLQSASIMLGKALNDPVSNLGALSRAGIQFSERQEQVIKAMAKTGDLAAAQTIILDELNRQYGGQAAAAAQTGAGALKQFNNVLGDIKELGGQVIQSFLTPFLQSTKPVLEFLAGISTDGAKGVMVLTATVVTLDKLPTILGAIGSAAKLLGISVKIAAGPVGWIIAAVGVLAAAWIGNLGGIQEKTKVAFNFITAAFSAIWEFLKKFAGNIGGLFGGIGDIIAGAFTFNLDRIKDGVNKVKDALTVGISDTLEATKKKFQEQLNDVKKARNDVQKDLNANPIIIPIQTSSGSGSKKPTTTTPMEIAGPRGMPEVETAARSKELIDELNQNALQRKKDILAQEEEAERASYARRQQQFDEWMQVYFSGYDTFWGTIWEKDMTGAQRADAVWQSMRGSFTKLIADRLKAYLIGEMKVTAIQKTEGVKQLAARKAFAAEDLLLSIKAVGRKLIELAANLWAWFSKLGPIGMIGGAAAVAGFVALARKAISGIRGMAQGGLVEKPTFALVGEAGPEIVAPQKSFIDVIRGAQLSGALSAGGGINSFDVFPVIKDIFAVIKDINENIGKIYNKVSEFGNHLKQLIDNKFRGFRAIFMSGGLYMIPLAHGGLIDRPTMAMVGEAGREIVAPEQDFKSYTSKIFSHSLAVQKIDMQPVLERLERIESAVAGLQLRVTGEEIFLLSQTGSRAYERKRI